MQLYKRFNSDQVKALLKGYHQGILDRSAIEEILGISKTRFFALSTQYRRDADKFALAYQRSTPTRISASAEREIERELMLEKGLIEDATLPITTYGIPLRYYVDFLRVFRFVQGRDSFWRKHILQTDEADSQWIQAMRILGVDVTYAISPQAKGTSGTKAWGVSGSLGEGTSVGGYQGYPVGQCVYGRLCGNTQ
ncbi:MAG: hypothetical protein DDT27_00770 [Dehalococcoidia bacterium]|nr:hypothetical protein [Chloroflexota bacterium]MBT9162224.1 hypothetical protein [Chloroflexota bacterium]